MDGRQIAALGLGLLMGLLAVNPAEAISKCADSDGHIHYLQVRTCPVEMRSLDIELPQLGIVDRGDAPVARRSIPKASPRDRHQDRARLRAAVACEALKRDFAATNEPCRGVSGCRERQRRRDRVRLRYTEERCAFSTGDIDSRYAH